MRIFKFGGASVKDADGVKNVFDVLQKELANTSTPQTEGFKPILADILTKTKVEQDLYSILKNQKLTSVLEQNTRNTLIKLNILK